MLNSIQTPSLSPLSFDQYQIMDEVGEDQTIQQPILPAELIVERNRINDRCYNKARVSPETLIQRALRGGIGFLDLFAYHEMALNPEGKEFATQNPEQKFVSVGMEFTRCGKQCTDLDYNPENTFYINYDAFLFLKRLPNNSVRHINIDFPSTGFPKIGIEASNYLTTVEYLKQAFPGVGVQRNRIVVCSSKRASSL